MKNCVVTWEYQSKRQAIPSDNQNSNSENLHSCVIFFFPNFEMIPNAIRLEIYNNISWEKSVCPYVCLSVCLSVCPVCPVLSPQKSRWNRKFCLTKLSDILQGWHKNIQSHAAVLGEAKPSYVYSILKPHFRVSSPPKSWSQAIVCFST